MSPRPRKVSDEKVLGAAMRVMSRLSPTQITLADIAAEAGVTSGALVQRFGSKRALLLHLVEQAAGAQDEMFAGLRAAHDSPTETLLAYADCMAAMGESPGALAHHLSYLQLDLTDPDFHRHARAQAVATRQALQGLIEEAVGAGELKPSVDARALARALEVTVGGSLLAWAFYQDGSAGTWVREDVERLLSPHRSRRRMRGDRARQASGAGR